MIMATQLALPETMYSHCACSRAWIVCLAILRAAGVIKPDEMPRSLQRNIPVRAESQRAVPRGFAEAVAAM